jgi:hypothetical protein
VEAVVTEMFLVVLQIRHVVRLATHGSVTATLMLTRNTGEML